MEKYIEEYLNSFTDETIELIVRICWCPEKGDIQTNSRKLGDFYKAQARFDEALDVRTGEFITREEGIVFYWLNWLAAKKRFGFPGDFRLKKNELYRVLVRQKTPCPGDSFRAYYLEKVLEKNVKEPRLDPLYQFEHQYEKESFKMRVLIKNHILGWGIVRQYRKPRATFIASGQ